ncbi:epoxyqueuosine reductase [candidate division KSB1 bacterium]|nr:epoxyqueuosine reductase [candidate division KSB1 bacterium]MBL7095666.1 epoxyqueuosine reductase [candidate division KSB1 bacterium]
MLIENGASIFGFADLKNLPEGIRCGLPTGISIGIKLEPSIISALKDGPTNEYIEEYNRVNCLLDNLSGLCVEYLKDNGFQAHAHSVTKSKLKGKQLSTQLPHKTVATKAGLGWIGKCALLVTKEFGSAIRLTTVLTDANLPVADSVEKSLCGDCVECVKYCPGSAPTGNNWQVGMIREEFFDANACYLQTRKWMKERKLNKHICGICIAVCPWTEEYLNKNML